MVAGPISDVINSICNMQHGVQRKDFEMKYYDWRDDEAHPDYRVAFEPICQDAFSSRIESDFLSVQMGAALQQWPRYQALCVDWEMGLTDHETSDCSASGLLEIQDLVGAIEWAAECEPAHAERWHAPVIPSPESDGMVCRGRFERRLPNGYGSEAWFFEGLTHAIARNFQRLRR